MKLKIQYFSLFSYTLLALLAVLLWTVSLYLVHDDAINTQTAQYRERLQAQINEYQLRQYVWLQKRFYQISHTLETEPDFSRYQKIINQNYQLNPELRVIQILPASGLVDNEEEGASQDCASRAVIALTERATAGAGTFNCRLSEQQPMLAMAGYFDTEAENNLLLLVIDYFGFIHQFEQATGIQLEKSLGEKNITVFSDSTLKKDAVSQVFEFEQEGVKLGRVSLAMPMQGFKQLWMQQATWLIPLLSILVLVFYRAMYTAFIKPLFKLTHKIQRVVVSRHPGNTDDSNNLTPGLLVLYKYFMHLTQLTKHDPLTGLNNREIFEERLQQAMLEGKRSARKYALVFLDIDDFHRVNHELGPYIGDGLLRQLAKRLSRGLRETDSLARLEKDNFAMLLEFTDEDQITSLVGKIYQSLSGDYMVYGRKVKIAVSMGVAITPDHGQEVDELALKADQALLQAQKGEWPVMFYQQTDEETDYSGFTLVQSLRQAMDRDEFKLVYQPVMDLNTHKTSYFEALLRWKQPEQHHYSIERTIQLAEKNQLIKPLTKWIIETAVGQLQLMEHIPIKIAINLSMIDLHDENLPEQISQVLDAYQVPHSQLMIEITEGQIMQEPEQVINILEKLSAMGISLSIDDFGTGQASLTYLKKLPVEKLKIDQSFIKDMMSNDEDSAIVEATINLAHTLGIDVIAEGVESAEIHDLLTQMGCDYAQGYYISRPLEQDKILPWCDVKQTAKAS